MYELMNLLGKFQANAEVEIWDFQSPDEMTYNEVDDIYEIRHSCTSCDFSTSSTHRLTPTQHILNMLY